LSEVMLVLGLNFTRVGSRYRLLAVSFELRSSGGKESIVLRQRASGIAPIILSVVSFIIYIPAYRWLST
jgi:hypothetical protein